jgi:hypothetical protein
MKGPRDESRFGRGHDDGLEPLTPLDLLENDSVDALVRSMGRTAFGGRRLGEAADVLEAMVVDEDCFRVVTVSGAMTIAKQGLVLCEMIDRGWVQALVTTGAMMTHGFVEGAGMQHFKHHPSMRDEDLYLRGYNRVYDTIELEKNLDDTERILQATLSSLSDDAPLCSWTLLRELGRYLAKNNSGRAILTSAFQKDVPVYVPAFTDSELGLDVAIYKHTTRRWGSSRSGAVSRATGRNRSGPISRSCASGWALASRCAATSTACESVPSRSTGVVSRAARIRKGCPGASSSRPPKADASRKSTPMPRSPGRSWCAP